MSILEKNEELKIAKSEIDSENDSENDSDIDEIVITDNESDVDITEDEDGEGDDGVAEDVVQDGEGEDAAGEENKKDGLITDIASVLDKVELNNSSAGTITPLEDDPDINETQKITEKTLSYLIEHHYPENILLNFEEIETLAKVFRNKYGDIIDDFHKTLPFITRFEKAKILGIRANQLNTDPSLALVDVDSEIIDGYKVALEEYRQKKIPFIIKRPLPKGICEYWKFSDLQQL